MNCAFLKNILAYSEHVRAPAQPCAPCAPVEAAIPLVVVVGLGQSQRGRWTRSIEGMWRRGCKML